MDRSDHKEHVLKLLQQRNAKEHSFAELIKYSSKLLENLDFVQKASVPRKSLFEQKSSDLKEISDALSASDTKLKSRCEMLEKDNAECHAKIAGFAEQVIKLKDTLDDKNVLLVSQKSELDTTRSKLKNREDECKTLQGEVAALKKLLQNKNDEYNALNITYSSIEGKKYNLELENKKLRTQLMMFQELERKSLSSDSSESAPSSLTSMGSNRSLNKMERNEEPCHSKFSPERLAAAASRTRPEVTLPEKVKFDCLAHDGELNAVLWFADPTYFLTAGSDRRVKLWKYEDGNVRLIKCARDCNSSIFSLDVDSESSLVLCASGDFASRVWSISDFTLRHTLTGHSGKVMSAKFINESYKIVSGSTDQTLKLWDFPRKVCTYTFNAHSAANDVYSKDSTTVISGHNDSKIRFWDTRAKSEVASIRTTGKVTSLDLFKNLLLASEHGGKLGLYDLRTHVLMRCMTGKNFDISCNWTRTKFTPDGRYCCCGSNNGSVFVWKSSTGTLEREYSNVHNSHVIDCSWSRCGTYLATSDSHGKCMVWCK